MSTTNFNFKNIITRHKSAFNNITLLIGSILFTNAVVHGLQKCYVCGPPSRSCEHFIEHKEEFIKECPPNSKGCSIQINGTSTTRSCEVSAFSDCKTANEVRYCYCHTNLCNANMSTKKQISDSFNNNSNDKSNNDDDDEDDDPMLERSGNGPSILDFMEPKTTSTTTETLLETNSSTNVISTMSIILLSLLAYF